MKTLVTGGSGYLGTHIRRILEADDFSRRSNLDVLNMQDVQIVQDYDVVVHLAAHLDKSTDAAEQVFLTNVDGTINLLNQMKKDSVFVFASTKDVYGRFADNHREVSEDCQTLYAGQSALEWSKLIAERYVEYYANQNGFRSCIFRLSTVYAPRSEGNTPNLLGHLADAINKGERIVLPAEGTPRRDLMHVEDLASACTAFVESVIRHGLYNLGGGISNSLSIREMITKLEEISGLQAVIDSDISLPAPVPMNYVSDLSRVKQELDWDPKVTLDEGFRGLF